MREIKFRAWDNKKKEWLLGYEMPNLGGFNLCGECVLLGEWAGILDMFLFERNGYKQDDLKVMQFTGLKDKNGKEIYEGDILYGKNLENFNEIAEVKWDSVQWYPLAGHRALEEYEVIGNIYENPELVQSQNQTTKE